MTLQYAERQLRYFQRAVAQLRQTSDASDATKEVEEGKEDIPPTPPIEEKGEGEEITTNQPTTSRVGAPVREGSRPTSELEVVAYFQERGFKSDPSHFYLFYSARGWKYENGQPIDDWRCMAGLWERRQDAENAPNKAKPKREKKQVTTPSKDALKFFSDFWQSYPANCGRKADKQRCAQAFYDAIGEDPDHQCETYNRIMQGLLGWKKCNQWQEDGGRYICAPLVWLHQRRWEDYPTKNTMKGSTDAYSRKHFSEHANYHSPEAQGAF